METVEECNVCKATEATAKLAKVTKKAVKASHLVILHKILVRLLQCFRSSHHNRLQESSENLGRLPKADTILWIKREHYEHDPVASHLPPEQAGPDILKGKSAYPAIHRNLGALSLKTLTLGLLVMRVSTSLSKREKKLEDHSISEDEEDEADIVHNPSLCDLGF